MSVTNHSEVLQVPLEHACYAGHFPGKPVVPGAVLMHWIEQRLSSSLLQARIAAVRSMKFLATLHPGDECQLLFTQTGPGRVSVRCLRGGVLVCKGSLDVVPLSAEPEVCQ